MEKLNLHSEYENLFPECKHNFPFGVLNTFRIDANMD